MYQIYVFHTVKQDIFEDICYSNLRDFPIKELRDVQINYVKDFWNLHHNFITVISDKSTYLSFEMAVWLTITLPFS